MLKGKRPGKVQEASSLGPLRTQYLPVTSPLHCSIELLHLSGWTRSLTILLLRPCVLNCLFKYLFSPTASFHSQSFVCRMRTTLALALMASFLACWPIDVLAVPGSGLKHAPVNIHRRVCRSTNHHHRQNLVADEVAGPALRSASWSTPAGSGDLPNNGPQKSSKKMHRKRTKGKCAFKPEGNGSLGQAPFDDATQGKIDTTLDSQTPVPGEQGWHGGEFTSTHGTPQEQSSLGGAKSPNSEKPEYDHSRDGYQGQPTESETGSQVQGNPPAAQGVDTLPPQNGNDVLDLGKKQAQYDAPHDGYSSSKDGPQPMTGQINEDGVHCKGMRGSTNLSTNGKNKYQWFDPSLIHHGPGTFFGGGTNFWQGGACMFDGLPHNNLPSVAMDETYYQGGLACGTCVEIAPTSASLFSNSAKWSVETPQRGALPPGKKTVAIVSDHCPDVNQCLSGLDMHPDTWNSVTSGPAPSKLPIHWRFVNCKEAFERSGIKHLQVHWREGANPGFFQVQIRGNHEAVVKVEMRLGRRAWVAATQVDNSWWKWETEDTAGCGEHTPVAFRVTDWQGQTITSEVGTVMNKDLFFEANFDRPSFDGA